MDIVKILDFLNFLSIIYLIVIICRHASHVIFCIITKWNGMMLQYVDIQTPEMCQLAVGQNGMALQFVRKQTPEICITAVKQNSMSLEFVNDQSIVICREAYKKDKTSIIHVRDLATVIALYTGFVVFKDGLCEKAQCCVCLDECTRVYRFGYCVGDHDGFCRSCAKNLIGCPQRCREISYTD